MAVSKAQQNATNKWIAKAYDRINLTVPKGRKDEIQAFAMVSGESVNGFINRAIGEAMGENPQKPTGVQEARDAILTPETFKKAQEAAQNAGETVSAFIGRAVDVQAQRDKITLAMRPKEKAPDISET